MIIATKNHIHLAILTDSNQVKILSSGLVKNQISAMSKVRQENGQIKIALGHENGQISAFSCPFDKEWKFGKKMTILK